MEKEPHACDFISALLGTKNCHFDPRVSEIRTGRRTESGGAVVSYDDGKTWLPNSEEPRIKHSVFVTWEKIED